jgi:hypothetical protein
MQIKATFKLDRETKGAVRYQEVDAHGNPETVYHAIGTLYVRKTAFPKGTAVPAEVTVTVDA